MSIARNTVFNVVGACVPIAVTLVTVPIYLKTIGVERYGVLSVAWLLLGYFGFFNLGLGPALARLIAGQTDERPAFSNQVFWTALWLSLGLGTAGASFLLVAGYIAFGAISGLSGTLVEEARAAAPWLAGTLPVATMFGVLNGALVGRERFLLISVTNSISSILMSILPLLVAVYYGPELSGLIAASLVSRIIVLGILFRHNRRAIPVGAPCRPNPAFVRQLLSFGGWLTISSVISPLLAGFDRFVIGVIAGAAAVTYYVVPFNLAHRILILPQSLSTALFPRLSSGISESEAARLRIRATEALKLIITPVVLLGVMAVEPFLKIWVGDRIASFSAPVAHILLVGLWVNSMAYIPYASLLGHGRSDWIAMVHLSELLPYTLVLALALYLFDVKGAALAWVMRVTVDAAVLYALDRRLRAAAISLAFPAVIVVCAATTTLLYPVDSLVRWLALGVLGMIVLIWLVRNVPASLRNIRPKDIISLLRTRQE